MTTPPHRPVRHARTALRPSSCRRLASLALAGVLAACSGSEPETSSATAPQRSPAAVAASPDPTAPVVEGGTPHETLAAIRSAVAFALVCNPVWPRLN